jgi:hypothetical protein
VAQLSTSPESLHQRLATSREAARYAARESVAIKAAVDQRLAESAACLAASATVLLHLGLPAGH